MVGDAAFEPQQSNMLSHKKKRTSFFSLVDTYCKKYTFSIIQMSLIKFLWKLVSSITSICMMSWMLPLGMQNLKNVLPGALQKKHTKSWTERLKIHRSMEQKSPKIDLHTCGQFSTKGQISGKGSVFFTDGGGTAGIHVWGAGVNLHFGRYFNPLYKMNSK